MARRQNKADTPADIDDMSDEELEAAMAAEAAATDQPEDDAPEPEPAPEPEADATPEDAAPAEDADDDGDDGKQPDTVPHERFHHERERRKRAEEIAERRERQLTQILATIGKGNQPEATQAQPERDDPPPLDEDPAGYIQWQSRQIAKLNETIQQTVQTGEQRSQTQALLQASNYDMQSYATEHPEANEAFAFLAEQGKRYLADNGIFDPNQQAHELNAWQVRIAQSAQQLGIRPAAMLMTLARENGWAPAAPATKSAATPDPKAAAAAIDAEEANKAKARSMKDTGAPVETGGLTVEMLDNMSDAEFNELLEKKFKGDFDAMERALLA